MAAGSDAATLKAAVCALYGSAGEDLARANAWLNAYSQTPAAWDACLQLLEPLERPEVSFFCANLLLSKVRCEWHKLSAEQAASMGAVISNKFQLFVGHAEARLAMQRLGLLLAAVASMSGAAACQTFAGQCVGMISVRDGAQPHMMECALSMLTALADEVHNMDKGRRHEMVTATNGQWAHIAALAQGFIPDQMAAGDYGLVHGSLLCLQAWLRLSSDASNTCRLSPGQLAAAHPFVLGCLFNLLGAPASEAVTSERIEGLARELLCELLGPGTVGSDERQEQAVLEAAMGALVGMRDAALAPGPVGAGVARSVASIASALAQRDVDTVCGCSSSSCSTAAVANGNGLPLTNGHAAAVASAAGGAASANVLPLAELMLQLVSRPERVVCESAVDYFLMANTLPAAQRPPQLLQPMFSSLITPLVRGHACYGPNFVSWLEELDDDEEDFYRFRDQGLSELLETVFLMTGPLYLSSIQDTITAASSWQQVEAALFCLKAVAGRIKRQPSSASPAAQNGCNGQQQRGQQEQQLLSSLFETLCSQSSSVASFLSNGYVCATAASLVGAFAAWFDNTVSSPLEHALRLLLHALEFRESWHAAATAFRALTSRCAARLANAAVLQSLAAAATATIAPMPQPGQVPDLVHLQLEDRQAVLEGLVRVVTYLNPPTSLDCALSLQQPLLARTQAILTHGSSTAAQGGPAAKQLLQHLAQELHLMAVLIRGMEVPAPLPQGVMHPAMKLLEAAWPALTAVAEAPVCQQDADVVQALCEVYKRSVQTSRAGAKPLLVTLLKAVGDLFVATQHAASLDMLATITEVFGEIKSSPELALAQQQALEGAVAAVSSVLVSRSAAGQPLSASGDILQSLISVADTHLVFARDLLLSSSVVPTVFEWSIAATGLREREPVNASFSFLSHLLAATNKVFTAAAAAAPEATSSQQPGQALEQQAAVLQQCIAQYGEKLVRTLVLAVCDTAPRQLLRALGGVLYQLLQPSLTGEAGKQWLLTALQGQDLPGMSAGLLKQSDCETFAQLAVRQPPLTRGRFDALLMDFAAIPRGEGTSDALLAYEL